MSDQLLSEIVAAEREIRHQIAALELELADRRNALESELEKELRQEAAVLDEGLARALESIELSARREAMSVMAEAEAYAARIHSLEAGELDPIVVRHLAYLLPEGGNDRQNEQAGNSRPQGSAPRCS